MWWIVVTVLVLWVAVRWGNSAVPARGLFDPANDQLDPCPDSPNCVSSVDRSEQHRMAAIPLTTDAAVALSAIAGCLRKSPRTTIVTQTDRYIHAECRSLLLGFVDDLQFLIDPQNAVIHFRSASRVGRSDLGVNRARMERLRKQITAELESS